MKSIYTLLIVTISLAFAACEKCADCQCSQRVFHEEVKHPNGEVIIPAASRDSVLASEEICAKGNEYDTQIAAFEADSSTTRNEKSEYLNSSTGYFWWNYTEYTVTTCSCTKK